MRNSGGPVRDRLASGQAEEAERYNLRVNEQGVGQSNSVRWAAH